MFHTISLIGAALILLGVAADSAVAQVVKREPPLGALRPGQRLLVDDGTCGPGQIKEVIGGNHVKVGGHDQIVRERRCIRR